LFQVLDSCLLKVCNSLGVGLGWRLLNKR